MKRPKVRLKLTLARWVFRWPFVLVSSIGNAIYQATCNRWKVVIRNQGESIFFTRSWILREVSMNLSSKIHCNFRWSSFCRSEALLVLSSTINARVVIRTVLIFDQHTFRKPCGDVLNDSSLWLGHQTDSPCSNSKNQGFLKPNPTRNLVFAIGLYFYRE